jgi:hypothetical protein
MAAPIGNVNAMRNKPFAEAINRAIAQDDGVRLRAIAEALLTKAADGDMAAIKEFADRLDGKAVQQVAGAGENGEFITKMIVELVKANGS